MRGKRGVILLIGVAASTLLIVLWWPRPKAKPLYRVIVLPSLGGSRTLASAINNRGQIVGYSEAADGNCHLCLWDHEGGIEDLGPVTRALFHLNDAAQIAGTTLSPNGKNLAFVWDRAQGLCLLGTLGGTESVALGLNNCGQVVGWSRTAGGLKHAFVWDATTGMRDLGTPEGNEGEARAINDGGQIVGVSDEQPGRSVLWTSNGSQVTDRQLRYLFGLSGINNHGYTAGRHSSPGGEEYMVLWRQSGAPKRLFPIDHQIQCWPIINDANQILFAEFHRRWLEPITVGRLLPSATEYWIWDPNRGRIPLNPQALTRRSETLELFDLNDNGCLVGRLSGLRQSYTHGVLLEPIPERWRKGPVR
jgi:probable HAF family extracellular repeat protein